MKESALFFHLVHDCTLLQLIKTGCTFKWFGKAWKTAGEHDMSRGEHVILKCAEMHSCRE